MPKLSDLLDLVAAQPDEPLMRYALAMEYRNLGDLERAAETFRDLVRLHPSYVPSYLMLAQTLLALGLGDEARPVIEQGIEIARKAGDAHTASELEALL